MDYFSDKQRGLRPRTEEQLTPAALGGIVALIQSLISTGAFAYKYPEMCPDGTGPYGTDGQALSLAVQAEIPDLEWPLRAFTESAGESHVPDTLAVLDLIQFSYAAIAKPLQGSYHSFFQHHHLTFDVDSGREEFRARVNSILARNGIAYDLKEDGTIERLAPSVLREALSNAVFRTKDKTLNQMLEDARTKFLNPDPVVRRESVERLWDCWERIKTLEMPNDKRASVGLLLDKVTAQKDVRDMLEEEARKLTDIGNSFHIRHTETKQTLVSASHIIDYLFHRLFSMIMLLLIEPNRVKDGV
jgi:hypothetical protein